jgi:hypothetical protein
VKKRILISTLSLIAFVLITGSLFAQGDMLTREEKLVGSTSDFLVGIHSGIFDCNQEYYYPYNIGINAQYNYTPNVMKNWYMGAEIGSFFTQSPEDGNLREMGAIIGHISLYPGYSFTLNSKEFPEEGDFEAKLKTHKLKVAAGVTLGIPFTTYSSGSTYNPDNANIGFGFTAMVLYDMPNRLNLFGSVTNVAADMDGFGYDPETGNRTPGNDHQSSWWYKVGIAYSIFGR